MLFLPFPDEAVCQIRIRSKVTDRIVQNSKACERCKGKFENNELSKCNNCGRLERQTEFDYGIGRWICYCIRNNEIQEKELPALPHERREVTFYEKQINSLREEKGKLTEEVETHLEALEISEDWHKRQKQELLNKIKQQEAEISKFSDEYLFPRLTDFFLI